MTVRGGAATTDTADDAVLEDLVERVSHYIDSQTGRKFYADSADATRYYTTLDPYECRIDDLSAAATSVSVDYSTTRTYTAITVTTDYEFDPPNAAADGMPFTRIMIIPSSTYYFSASRRGVKVVGKFGFPAVPEDIKGLTMAIVLNSKQSRSGQSSNGSVTVTGAGVVIRPRDIPDWGYKVLANYRKYL